jgi:threonine/homoserine/homoserine lactone efflux protein
MPEPTTLALFALAAAALVAIPGPNHLYIATRSIADGRRAGLASGLGVETGTLVHTLAAAAGLSALVASSAAAFETVRWLGVGYLLVLAWRALRAAGPDAAADRGAGAGGGASLRRAYVDGVVVNVLNPKVALFFLAFLPQFVEPGRGPAALQAAVLGLCFVALGTLTDGLWALAAGGLGARLRRRPGLRRSLDRASGLVYVALGVTAAATGDRGRA